MRSVLEAFQTDQFARVKIGVGLEGRDVSAADYVLTPFSPASTPVVEKSCSLAARRIVDLLKKMRVESGVVGA